MLSVRNPATGQTAGAVESIDAGEVAGLVAAARAAQPGWHRLGFAGRAQVLDGLRRWLLANRDEVIDALVRESGKTRDDAIFTDWSYIVASLEFWTAQAERYLADEPIHPGSPFVFGKRLLTRYEPLGVVGVIGPWNFPLAMCFGDAIPALMAGNAVVLKPASLTPLSSQVILKGLRAVGGADGVLSVAVGRGTGPALVDAADMIMFTGSTEVGRDIAVRAAATLTPVSLELGGNDPMLVLADANLERAANAATFFGMVNSGQVCQSVERVYVEAPVYERFLALLADRVTALRQGADGKPGSADVGAMTDPAQVEVVREHVADAIEKGARVVAEATAAAGRQFSAPTVLGDCDHTMRVMMEETFGPVLGVMSVPDAETAVRLANDSPFGLSASVFTRDLARGEALARRIEAGGVYVNDVLLNAVAFEAPFGGWKDSGFGSRGGPGGIRKYCRSQLIGVAELAPKRELYYYPTSPRQAKLIERTMVSLQSGAGRRISRVLALTGRTPLISAATRAAGALRRSGGGA